MIRRRERQRDEQHLEWIRSLACVSCADDTATEAAHLRAGSLMYGKRPTGMQEKPSDCWTLPLCGRCHRLQHRGSELGFWTTRGINPFALALALHNVSGDHELGSEIIRAWSKEHA